MSDRRLLNIVLAVGIADALLLIPLLYVAFIDRNQDAISILGPIHGFGFLILLGLTTYGTITKRWGWWFPAIVFITGGPLGSIVGDVICRRDLKTKTPA